MSWSADLDSGVVRYAESTLILITTQKSIQKDNLHRSWCSNSTARARARARTCACACDRSRARARARARARLRRKPNKSVENLVKSVVKISLRVWNILEIFARSGKKVKKTMENIGKPADNIRKFRENMGKSRENMEKIPRKYRKTFGHTQKIFLGNPRKILENSAKILEKCRDGHNGKQRATELRRVVTNSGE